MSVEEQMIANLKDAIGFMKGQAIAARVVTMTARRATINPPPHFTREQIVQIREQLKMSQLVFARALNVTNGTVSAWEQGSRQPSGPALRLLEIAQKSPEVFTSQLQPPASSTNP